MPIVIKIEAANPEELAMWLGAMPGLKSGIVLPAEPALQAVNEALAAAIVDTVAYKVDAGEPTGNAFIDKAIEEKPAAKRGRPKKDAEPASANDPTPAGPMAAETLAHSHVPDDPKVGEVFDVEACKAVMRDVTEKLSYDATRTLLAKFQVARLGLLDPSLHKAFVEAGRIMIANGKAA